MADDPQQTPQSSTKSPAVLALFPSLVLIAAFVVFRKIEGLGLMGFDSYPLILTARIDSWGSFLGTFTEELMDGRYHGSYYRPVLNLSFALDHLLWGLKPVGYQLTGALLYGACAGSIGALMARLLRERLGAGVLAATLFFLLHDSHFEVIPVPARRPELLCGLFACISLGNQLRAQSLQKRWAVGPALWMLLAAGSKETGYALPAISVLAVVLYSPLPTVRERLFHGLRTGLVHGVLVLGLLAARVSVLGGLGGPGASPAGADGPSSLELTSVLFGRLFIPQNVANWGTVVPAFAVALGACALFACVYSSRGRSALGVAGAWMVVVGLMYGVARSIEQWYLFLPVVGLSLAVGACVDILVGLFEERRRAFGAVLAISLAGFFVVQTRYSPLFQGETEWTEATAASEEFFTKLARRIDRGTPGEDVKAPPIPVWYPPPEEGPGLRGGAVLEHYSVQAWLELNYPGRRYRVLYPPMLLQLRGSPGTVPGGPPMDLPPLEPDETVVLLHRPYLFPPASPANSK